MTADDIRALVDAVRVGETAEQSADPGNLSKIKAGWNARVALGRLMTAEHVYSTDAVPRTVWMLDPATGQAVEVQPMPLAPAAPAKGA